MKARLKQYYPLALEVLNDLDSPLACEFLLRWSSLTELQQEDPKEIAAFYRQQHYYRPKLIDARLEKIARATPLVNDEAILESGRMCVHGLATELLSLVDPLKKYDRKLAQMMEQHPDGGVFGSFPGSGPAMAPRLLGAFGSDRERLSSADQMQSISGIAPVAIKSGKTQHRVRRRWACNKFLRQTFHE